MSEGSLRTQRDSSRLKTPNQLQLYLGQCAIQIQRALWESYTKRRSRREQHRDMRYKHTYK